MNPQIADYLRRPKRYYNIDGLGELSLGFMIACMGLLQYLQFTTPSTSVWNKTYSLFLFAGALGAITHYGPKAIKEHLTYPRTGYVEYRKDHKAGLWAGVLAMLVAVVLTGAVVRNRGEFSAAPALVGLAVTASYAYGFARGVRWKWLVASVMALSAVVIAAVPSVAVESWAEPSHLAGPFPAAVAGRYILLATFFGVTLLVSGGITLGLYLHRTQPHTLETK